MDIVKTVPTSVILKILALVGNGSVFLVRLSHSFLCGVRRMCMLNI